MNEPESPLDFPQVQPDKANPVRDLAYAPTAQQPNNLYRLERGVIRLRNGKTVPAREQFKGAPLYGKVNALTLTRNPGVVNPAAGGISASGSVPKIVSSPNYTFTAPDPTTLVIAWPLYANRLIDGTAIVLQPGSITITGLTANTLYYYHPFWSMLAGAQGWVQGGIGIPAIAFLSVLDHNLQIQILQQNFSLGTISYTQPTSGSGSGSSGGSGGFGGTGGGGRTGPNVN